MPPVEISYERTLGFDKFGQSVSRAQAHMKFSPSFVDDGCVGDLKGPPLSCYIIIGLHEVKILLGQAQPLSLIEIQRLSKYSRPSVTEALDFLVERNYITELAERGDKNEKQYRVRNYMWFGSNPSSPISGADGKKYLPSDASDESRPRGRSREIATDNPCPTNGGRSRHIKAAADNGRSRDSGAPQKIFTPAKKIFPPHVHDDDVRTKQNQDSETSSSIHARAAIEKILREAGFEGINVQRIAENIDEIEIAEAWAEWLSDPETTKRYRNPHGIAYGILMERPNMRPHFFKPRAESSPATRRPVISGKLADRAWHDDENRN